MKKDLEYYMSLPYKLVVVIDPDEGGYVMEYPELPGCLSCCEKREDVMWMAEDAKKCWLEAALEDLESIPEPKLEKTA